MKKFCNFIILLILIGCTNQPTEIKSKKTVNYNINSVEPTEKNCNFLNFVNSFSSDSIFQKNHIKFPLKITISELENGDSTFFLKGKDWHFHSLKNGRINNIKYIHEIDTLKYKITEWGIDTGIRIDYFFSHSENTWQLIKVVDSSN